VVAINLVHTNEIDSYVTNTTTKFLTNEIAVNLMQTNIVDQYRTNWAYKFLTNEIAINLTRTNIVDSYRTNWATKRVTNELAVNLVETNFVAHYRTNVQALNLTNWQTVVVMKTNWVNQPMTNTVQVDLPASQRPAMAANANSAATIGSVGLTPITSDEAPTLEALRAPRPAANNNYEITLRVKWASSAPNQTQHWWIERDDGAYLSVGQEREFRRELPPGNYRVETKVQHDQDSPVLTLRGTLVLTARDAVVRQKASAKKLAAN